MLTIKLKAGDLTRRLPGCGVDGSGIKTPEVHLDCNISHQRMRRFQAPVKIASRNSQAVAKLANRSETRQEFRRTGQAVPPGLPGSERATDRLRPPADIALTLEAVGREPARALRPKHPSARRKISTFSAVIARRSRAACAAPLPLVPQSGIIQQLAKSFGLHGLGLRSRSVANNKSVYATFATAAMIRSRSVSETSAICVSAVTEALSYRTVITKRSAYRRLGRILTSSHATKRVPRRTSPCSKNSIVFG